MPHTAPSQCITLEEVTSTTASLPGKVVSQITLNPLNWNLSFWPLGYTVVFFFRYDWYKMGNFVIISIFAKLSDPEQTFVEANKTIVSRTFVRTICGNGDDDEECFNKR